MSYVVLTILEKINFNMGYVYGKDEELIYFLWKKVHLQSLLMRAFPELNISEEYLVYEIVKKYILSQEFVYKKVYLKKI